LSVFFLFDEQSLGGAHVDRVLYLVADVVGRFVVEYLDRAALGNLENIGRLELTHGVALTQIQIYFDSVTHGCSYLARLR
jgi:hypothetical protein